MWVKPKTTHYKHILTLLLPLRPQAQHWDLVGHFDPRVAGGLSRIHSKMTAVIVHELYIMTLLINTPTGKSLLARTWLNSMLCTKTVFRFFYGLLSFHPQFSLKLLASLRRCLRGMCPHCCWRWRLVGFFRPRFHRSLADCQKVSKLSVFNLKEGE